MSCSCSEGMSERTIGFKNNDPKRRIFAPEAMPTGLGVHNCEYIARRNSVLNEAERIATEHAGKLHEPGWQQAFSHAVNRLSTTKLPKE